MHAHICLALRDVVSARRCPPHARAYSGPHPRTASLSAGRLIARAVGWCTCCGWRSRSCAVWCHLSITWELPRLSCRRDLQSGLQLPAVARPTYTTQGAAPGAARARAGARSGRANSHIVSTFHMHIAIRWRCLLATYTVTGRVVCRLVLLTPFPPRGSSSEPSMAVGALGRPPGRRGAPGAACGSAWWLRGTA